MQLLSLVGPGVQVWEVADSAHLIAQAFPAVTELKLCKVELGDGALFSMLAAQARCPLTSLTLHWCEIKDTAVQVAATALAQLPSLRAFHVRNGGTLPSFASQLTALTHLGAGLEAGLSPPDTQLVKAVSRNKGLQSLDLLTSSVPLAAGMLQHLLMGCSSLTQLDLTSQDVDDQKLDILLEHGTNLTDVRLGRLCLTRSRAGHTCRWQSLLLVGAGVLAGLANLPLKSVQELQTTYDSERAMHLPLIPSSQLVPLLQQAASNLGSCPAWQEQPAGRVALYTDLPVAISKAQKLQLLSALSPLGGPHLQHLSISIKVTYDQQEVQVLGRSLGSTLKSLSLHKGIVKPSFWSALSQHLPHLNKLGFAYTVAVTTVGMSAYLRTVAQPFTLYIGPRVLPDQHIADLVGSIGAGQMQGVSLRLERLNDDLAFQELDYSEDEQVSDSEGNEEVEVADQGATCENSGSPSITVAAHMRKVGQYAASLLCSLWVGTAQVPAWCKPCRFLAKMLGLQ
jgi:hypothetical protein